VKGLPHFPLPLLAFLHVSHLGTRERNIPFASGSTTFITLPWCVPSHQTPTFPPLLAQIPLQYIHNLTFWVTLRSPRAQAHLQIPSVCNAGTIEKAFVSHQSFLLAHKTVPNGTLARVGHSPESLLTNHSVEDLHSFPFPPPPSPVLMPLPLRSDLLPGMVMVVMAHQMCGGPRWLVTLNQLLGVLSQQGPKGRTRQGRDAPRQGG